MEAAARQGDKDWMTRHGVNIGMALKAPALNFERTRENKYTDALKTGWNDLMLLHGLPMGIFSGDEDLHGNDPTQGIELCAIVESMFSLEKIIAITGDVQYMDALERMTFNALPTQTTDDYNMKQYFQIANQVEVSRGVFDFSLPFEREMNNVFGLRSGYTCCTANMHQGWTKFAAHLWYATPDNGLAALEYSPSEVTTKVGSTEVTITEQTDFPFSDVVNFGFAMKKNVSFPLSLRIPSWCKEAVISLNGQVIQKEKGGKVIIIEREWKSKDILTLYLPMEVTTSNWGKNSRAVERGPLVYALKLNERWEKGVEENEGEYYSVYTTDDWNYGILESIVKNPTELKANVKGVNGNFVWNQKNAPIEITVKGKRIPNWKVINGVAHQPVTARDGLYQGEVENAVHDLVLIPYGCSKVRIVAFPVVR
jgi:hypothetical protein